MRGREKESERHKTEREKEIAWEGGRRRERGEGKRESKTEEKRKRGSGEEEGVQPTVDELEVVVFIDRALYKTYVSAAHGGAGAHGASSGHLEGLDLSGLECVGAQRPVLELHCRRGEA